MPYSSCLRLLFSATILGALLFPPEARSKINLSQEITGILKTQAEAWNKADLNGFMASYLNSPEMSYSSGGTEVWGFESLKKRYTKKYGTGIDTMGHLSFSDLKISPLGTMHALCLGHWHLERRERNKSLSGSFSLVLVKDHSAWKILHDHSSVKRND